MSKKKSTTEEADGIIDVAANVQTAQDMIANGADATATADWLHRQVDGAFARVEDAAIAIGS